MATEPTTARGRATRARILQAASELIFRNGVGAVRLDDVEAAAGVGRSQLYHYFTDRDDLVRAVVHATIDTVLAMQKPRYATLDSLLRIDEWFESIIANGIRPEGVGGCAIGLLAAQLSEHDHVTRQAFLDAFTRWEAPLIEGLSRMQQRGELAVGADVVELADLTMAAIQGGLLLAHVRRSPHQIRLALQGARAALLASTASSARPDDMSGASAGDLSP
ncbi:TetR/AcrR family transcriptional regulator [Actinoplanes sp. RD1]|uniref:TetR/AcrR family transcriptional regulator n=1 Tax=Actinoplanes sp. RD1 TaxID=3064538 RepID=UPI002740E432|nr:TetR/AcrR family transcriptional regulator [Actinoplanes sp. RD1]